MKINLHVAGLSFNQSYSFIVLPGITMKNATEEKAKECRIVDKTDSIVHDTTSSITGCDNGKEYISSMQIHPLFPNLTLLTCDNTYPWCSTLSLVVAVGIEVIDSPNRCHRPP